MNLFERFKPGIAKGQLYFIACGVWGVAGVLLCYRGGVALGHEDVLALVIVGIIAGVTFYHYMFFRIPKRHIARIKSTPHDWPCAFSFLDWKGYGMMALMISLGITLRMTHVVSDSTLGIVYTGMGVALLISAFQFARAGLAQRHRR